MRSLTCDVVIVGAGFAGVAAADRLARNGSTVIILEARARIGGRIFTREFSGDGGTAGEPMEFGGAWITPWHTRVSTLTRDHGLTLRAKQGVTERLWFRDGTVHRDGATSLADRIAHERTLARVAADAAWFKAGHTHDEVGGALVDLSFAEYLSRLNPPGGTRELFSAWWTVSGNGDPREISAGEFLSSCMYGGGLAEGMIDAWGHTIAEGGSTLARRMLEHRGIQVILDSDVRLLVQDETGISAGSAGETVRARAAIVASGLNPLRKIRFEPPLGPNKQRMIGKGHGGRSFKAWIRGRGVRVGTLATGSGSGVEFAFVEREDVDGNALIVCFGVTDDSTHLDSKEWIDSQVAKFFPAVRVDAYDFHDWVTDPYSLGTWAAAPVGFTEGLNADHWKREGRIAFASSDFASQQAGWIEGAVLSGEEAAEEIAGFLTNTR